MRNKYLRKNEVLSLVDYLAEKLGCDYISDLHFLNAKERLKMSIEVQKLNPEDWPIGDWNDALGYIANKPATDSCQSAYSELLAELK